MSGPTALAVEHLKADGLVAFPTETVWGLAARAESAAGLERLRSFKGRSSDHPVSLLVSGSDCLTRFGFELSPTASALTEEFWPGPLTLVLPCRHRFADGVARGDGAVGVRCSSHPAAAELVREVEKAGAGLVTATSLNRTGDPPARTRDDARKLSDQGLGSPLLLETEADAGGEAPSAVVDWTGRHPVVLRDGGLGKQLTAWLAERGLSALSAVSNREGG